ncbi:MAG: twin-arginine translocase TatA/TatE family subunit [Anaerovibrio sp.]|nr:twin-arginine translocase TatA/TatE family subunit [Selenomonadaceae bacterium]MDD6398305.1 twin-arginine translocase TatA/TatE family subunit [Selenomonadaceae bacterium]MDY6052865.1 twin-arginine translocase TatA/TatE family subunit [Anaerovibrio sp.]
MFGLGLPELLVILVIGLIIFGPGKLPGVGKALGQSIREFKAAEKEKPEAKNQEMLNVTEESKVAAQTKEEDK